ncbi:MAG: ATP-dependent DNA ligase [Candidatus Heimdallarchaeota archaeon]|nr:ATP-dependent DNA ligase [Candidatus Heimdallarchaeota archaeon]
MQYAILADTFAKLEATRKRLQMIDILTELFREIPKDKIRRVVYFTSGKVYPDYLDFDLGLADKMVIRAISKAVGKTELTIETLYKQLGDLGETAENLLESSRQKSLDAFMPLPEKIKKKRLTVEEVWETLDKITQTTGKGSTSKKIGYLSRLYLKAEPLEAKYITRTVLSQLRLGVKDLTIIEALSRAFGETDQARPPIEHAYNIRSDIGEVAEILVKEGLAGVKKIGIQLGRPIRMMAAQRIGSIEEILEKLGGKCALEFKYDGERVQAHIGKEVHLFSRNLNDITTMYPDVAQSLRATINAKQAIVEGEITAWNPEDETFEPFQKLMSRKRKYDIDEAMAAIPVKVFLFDILYLNGHSLLSTSYPERRETLESLVREGDKIIPAAQKTVNSSRDFEEYFETALEYGCEGVMAKDVREETPYQAGNRGFLWIKHKFDYSSAFVDSYDLVVVGGFHGKGKRRGLLGTVLMAAYNPTEERFETVCKLGSGFTDEDLERVTKDLKQIQTATQPQDVYSKLEPDIWVYPEKVFEIQGADLSTSPVHTCALGELKQDAGIAIRFPRFTRYREDKSAEQATTTEEILQAFHNQRSQN